MSWWERVTAWERRHRFLIDAVLTALAALAVSPFALLAVYGTVSDATQLFWSLAVVVPLAWRRVRPVGSVVAVYAAALAHLLVAVPIMLPADLAVLVALYSVTVHGPRWAHRTAIVSALVGGLTFIAVLAAQFGVGSTDVPALVASLLLVWMAALVTWAFGLVRRSRRETIGALVDRAGRLEVERDQQARIATAAERTRIAREMHDIVAHSLSVIIAQADGGRYAAQADGDAATRALGTIGETGRAALADMRRLLGVLRTDDGDPASRDAATSASEGPTALAVTPQPAEHDIELLVEQMRSSGMHAALVRMGTPRRLPPGIGLAVYRICQEALTNILKHAGPAPSVTVVLQWRTDGLVLEVGDDGRGAAADTDGLGQGLLGMRERATMFGGTLTAGPRPGGGFRVRAELPLPTAS